jgi:hypothetical protein
MESLFTPVPEFEMLVKFEHLNPADVLEQKGKQINLDYMAEFGSNPKVRTVFVVATTGAYDFLIRFRGTLASAEWLGQRISETAEGMGGSAEVVIVEIAGDITAFFDRP